MPDLEDIAITFEGPALTHFVLDTKRLTIHAYGAEASLLASDFVEFLLHIDQAATLLPFTAPDGQTSFVIEDEFVYVHADGEVVFPLEALEAFLEHLTAIGEASTIKANAVLKRLRRETAFCE